MHSDGWIERMTIAPLQKFYVSRKMPQKKTTVGSQTLHS
jgi:hypothetical protein